MKHYKLTEAELEWLGELSADENTAWGRTAFCLGLIVNIVLGLLFATGLDGTTKGAAGAIGVIAVFGALRFGWDAGQKRSTYRSLLAKVKEDHVRNV